MRQLDLEFGSLVALLFAIDWLEPPPLFEMPK
jgi:hypothetical protein